MIVLDTNVVSELSKPTPDAILTSGVPVVVYQHQLDEAKQRGIPVVDWASANPPNSRFPNCMAAPSRPKWSVPPGR